MWVTEEHCWGAWQEVSLRAPVYDLFMCIRTAAWSDGVCNIVWLGTAGIDKKVPLASLSPYTVNTGCYSSHWAAAKPLLCSEAPSSSLNEHIFEMARLATQGSHLHPGRGLL